MSNKIEQPYHTPFCCSKLAKWVRQSPNLAYFYCAECKQEVPEVSGIGGNDKWQKLIDDTVKQLDATAQTNFWNMPQHWSADPGGLLPQGTYTPGATSSDPPPVDDDEDPHIYTKTLADRWWLAEHVQPGRLIPIICSPKNKDVK